MSEQAVFDTLRYRIEVDKDGTCRYFNTAGQLHRENGHAIEWADGSRFWWQNGQYHRTDGPAIEWASGVKSWWLNGQRHRTDGPAIEYTDGRKEWWVNGKGLTEAEFIRLVKQNV